MLNCTTDRYAELYASWLKNQRELLALAGYRMGEALLDLCGGTGAVAMEAIRPSQEVGEPSTGRLPDVRLLDLNPRCDDPRVVCVSGEAERADELFVDSLFDVVICRQAMAYLDERRVFKAVARVLKVGGRFVFNTFACPTEGGRRPWSLKTYRHEGARYFEGHLFRGNQVRGKVWHVQARWPVGVDVTRFTYLSSNWLALYAVDAGFCGRIIRRERSLRWRLEKLPDGTRGTIWEHGR